MTERPERPEARSDQAAINERDRQRIEADPRHRPTTDQPLNAEPRTNTGPVFAVVGLVAFVLLLFLAITMIRYAT